MSRFTWAFITLLIGIVTSSETNPYETRSVDHMLLPVTLGNAYIVDDYNVAYYHINLTLIKNSIQQLNDTFNNITCKDIPSDYRQSLYSILNFKAENVKTLLSEMQSEMSKITYYKRSKRGLFNFMGTIQKYLFGTMDNNDRIKYDSYVNTHKENQITINDN